ncbi:MAG: terpene cyclase/mutase family protein [Candidatus Obscuribacterales bacterium]|nr:terpene cyclase/mutase family protein [Candidatus Obscuribacterales bacterium]
MNKSLSIALAATLLSSNSLLFLSGDALADQTTTQSTAQPKEITTNVKKGLAYLASQQNKDGSWNQGEESPSMRSRGYDNGDLPNVADTCMAAMALLRAGSLPNSGQYSANVAKAALYVCSSVEKSDQGSLYITSVKGTRVQHKLGQFVDTFLASVFLPDVKGKMPTEEGNNRVAAALDKIIYKIEKNQASDGSWASDGWAPIHSKSLAMQGLNKAKSAGVKVNQRALVLAESDSRQQFNPSTKSFAGKGGAGVPLYAAGATLGALQSSVNNYSLDRGYFNNILKDKSTTEAKRRDAADNLRRIDDVRVEQQKAVDSVVPKLADKGFVQGFGCNGGEEFLSYMQISDSLLANKSKEWNNWDKKITTNLNHVQLTDGSWMGQHCITSRTFCTAAALMVLTADRQQAVRNIASTNRGQKGSVK